MKVRCQICNEKYNIDNLVVDYFINEKGTIFLYGVKFPKESNRNIEINKIICPKCNNESIINMNILNYSGNNILERMLTEIKHKSSNIPNFEFLDESEE